MRYHDVVMTNTLQVRQQQTQPALPEQQSCATDLRFCAAVSAGDLWPAARQLSPAPGDVKGK